MYSARDIIATKRDGKALSKAHIDQFISELVAGSFLDYQASALLMAIVLNGMSAEETAHLTSAMLRSGKVLELPEINRPKIDKHSTGGVGDKVSLILAPIAAALGLCVPMISGRGLGHTGGTLDKLESIPGFRTQLSESDYKRQLEAHHLAIIGQSKEMVPADRILYGLRDVTATVESIPLIVSSILSKKLAAGIDGLVLDVKCGKGAFMKTETDARVLAKALVSTSHELGKPACALITRMDAPLGCAIGNSLEVIEAIECLKGRGPSDLMELTEFLVMEMLELSGMEASPSLFHQVVANGSALDAFRMMVSAQGGNAAVIDDYSLFPVSNTVSIVNTLSEQEGYITEIDSLLVGEVAHALGAGRTRANEAVDPSVGVLLTKQVGDLVSPGDSLAKVYYRDSGKVLALEETLQTAFHVSKTPLPKQSILIDTIHP